MKLNSAIYLLVKRMIRRRQLTTSEAPKIILDSEQQLINEVIDNVKFLIVDLNPEQLIPLITRAYNDYKAECEADLFFVMSKEDIAEQLRKGEITVEEAESFNMMVDDHVQNMSATLTSIEKSWQKINLESIIIEVSTALKSKGGT